MRVSVDIVRTENDFFTLDFHETGTVMVPCDLCLEPMEQSVETTQRLEAKFGTENSEEDDLVMVAEDEGILDITWYLYEFIALAIPIRHVHAPGKCNPAMIRTLEEYSATRSGQEEDETPMDPRWEALSKLKESYIKRLKNYGTSKKKTVKDSYTQEKNSR